MPVVAPYHHTFHSPWKSAFVANSTHGANVARRLGYHWTDNDFHLTAPSAPGGIDCAWCNGHGAPELFWLPRGDRFEHHTAAQVFNHHRRFGGIDYHIRNAAEALHDNARNNLGTEFEVKDVRPWNTPEILDAAFARVARHAEAAYGPNWRNRVVVKVLTNLGGGVPYALGICAAAHAHGIPTMLLARGLARWNRFSRHPEVTYVRGSAVIR